MTKPKLFKDARAFRTALEERLKSFSRKNGIDLNRLRKQVSFERFLARLFSKPTGDWRLKGGYAMQLRHESARATKDVDLALKELKLQGDQSPEIELLNQLQQQMGKSNPDLFTFGVTGPIMDLTNAPYGGSRFLVDTRLDNRPFEKFHVDVGIGDVWIDRTEELPSSNLLEFAGIPQQNFPAISREQHFAEKLHAYTLPRDPSRPNSRVKDLIDLVLILQDGDLDRKALLEAIRATYQRRKTHDFSSELLGPPAEWMAPYAEMATECGLPTDIDTGFKIVLEFVRTLQPFSLGAPV